MGCWGGGGIGCGGSNVQGAIVIIVFTTTTAALSFGSQELRLGGDDVVCGAHGGGEMTEHSRVRYAVGGERWCGKQRGGEK